MKKLKIFLIIFVLITIQSFPQRTFYIDYENGNDGFNGRSMSKPWKTVSRINYSWKDIKAGDKILFKRGGYWAPDHVQNLALIEVPDEKSGLPGKFITISAYGSGEKPILSCKNLNKKKLAFLATGTSFFILMDLEIHGAIRFDGLSDNGNHDLKFINLTVNGKAKGDVTGADFLFNPGRKELAAEKWLTKPVYNIEIGYCEFKNYNGVHFLSADENIWVHHNKFMNAQTEALDFGSGNKIKIEYNIFSGAGNHCIKVQPQTNSASKLLLRGNLIMGAGKFSVILLNITDSEIYNNTIFTNSTDEAVCLGWEPSNPIYITGKGKTGFENNKIQNNIIYGGLLIKIPEKVFLSYKDGTTVYYHQGEIWEKNYFANNVIFGKILRLKYKEGTSVFWDRIKKKYNNNSVYKIAELDFNREWLPNINVKNDVNVDPEFINPFWKSGEDYGDFHLKKKSPAVNKGAAISSYKTDLEGKKLRAGINPNPGAFE